LIDLLVGLKGFDLGEETLAVAERRDAELHQVLLVQLDQLRARDGV